MRALIGRRCRYGHEDQWYAYGGRAPACVQCQALREQRRPHRPPLSLEAAERKRVIERERYRRNRHAAQQFNR